MTMTQFATTDIPQDETPDTGPPPGLDYETYPDATEEAPYGYTPSGRIRKSPIGSKTRGGGSKGTASDSAAAMAASMLARMNGLIGISLTMLGMPMSADALNEANLNFELMAKEALKSDPKLCRKILSVGADTGKAGLGVSYLILGGSIMPAVVMDIRNKRDVIEGEVEDNAG